MMHPDFYSIEADLINTSKRSLCDGKDKDTITKMRLMVLSRGATGLLLLARSFRKMDDATNKGLSFEQIRKGFQDVGLKLDEDEVQEMFKTFDGSVGLTEFILMLRPPLSDGRLSLIVKAFEKMDKKGEGVITIEDLRKLYSVKDHPKYLNGEMDEDEILTEFSNQFKQRGIVDGRLTKEDFINYYASISASIDNDGYFDLLLRKAYKL